MYVHTWRRRLLRASWREVEDMEAPRRPVCDSAIEAVDDELATVCLQVRVSYTHVHVQKLPSVVCPTRLTTSVLGSIYALSI